MGDINNVLSFGLERSRKKKERRKRVIEVSKSSIWKLEYKLSKVCIVTKGPSNDVFETNDNSLFRVIYR